MKGKKSKIILGIGIALSLVISFTSGFFTHYFSMGKTNRLLSEITSIISNKAVDPDGNELDFSSDAVAKTVVNALLKNDDYAHYFSNSEYEEVISEGEGKFSGLGVSLYSNQPIIYSVIGNSPAFKAGLKANDKILKAKRTSQETFVSFSNTDQLISFIDSLEGGDEIDMVVERYGQEFSFTLSKEYYIASYVEYFDSSSTLRFSSAFGEKPQKSIINEHEPLGLDGDTALIVFTAFEGNSAYEIGQCMQYFYSQGKSKLILDLRGNGGGYMNCLIDVASYFINNHGKTKNLITRVQAKDGYEEYKTKANNFDDRLKNIVVLADENTASASECLIGAMLYYGDGNFSMDNLVIEYNEQRENYSTYGKGIMQTTYPLLSGGAIKLTTARLYQPDLVTCIHNKGITQTNPLNQANGNAMSRALEILG
ncbi:MAG: PDZ domain-containing protein [Clostridia bacterium]|nr:PDZ domain-containing protein [Clostridia bacterium]